MSPCFLASLAMNDPRPPPAPPAPSTLKPTPIAATRGRLFGDFTSSATARPAAVRAAAERNSRRVGDMGQVSAGQIGRVVERGAGGDRAVASGSPPNCDLAMPSP